MNNFTVEISSFGFKYAPPENADIVFDVRFLQNPYYVEELKPLTGLDQRVRDYIESFDESKEFFKKLFDMIDFLIPLYIEKERTDIKIAFGCTGGKHRSVTAAEKLYSHLTNAGYDAKKHHRDIEKQFQEF